MHTPAPPSVLVLACGALARELFDIVALNSLDNVTIECLPAVLHNRPKDIPAAITARLDANEGLYDRIMIGYADCGTGGHLDEICRRRGVTRLPGAHCYEFFAGREVFARYHDAEPGTFYLTDYLAKHFNRFIIEFLGIDRHPELAEMYFGNYRKLVYLAQTDDPAILAKAEAAAERLGLAFERAQAGYGELEPTLVTLAGRS